MRIIGGEFSGRRLKSIDRPGLRPTTDRVRESVFNMLAARIDFDGASVLDLYAGTGALGIEALSRGAARCVFVERDRRVSEVVSANLESLGLAGRTQVVTRDVVKYLQGEPKHYDLVFADPPYAATTIAQLSALVFNNRWLHSAGLFVLEHAGTAQIARPEPAELVLERSFGDTGVSMFRWANRSILT